MNWNNKVSNSGAASHNSGNDADESFAQAVTRMQAGEAIADILASYPVAQHDELREMLTVVQAVEQLGDIAVARPSPMRRNAAKQEFLAAAAQMRAQQATVTSLAATAKRAVKDVVEPAKPTSVPVQTTLPASRPLNRHAANRASQRRSNRNLGLWERFVAGLQATFSPRSLRLAPLVLMLAFVLLSTSTLVTLAQTSVPGDLAYTLKQWIRKQELELAPASQRDLVRLEQEREWAEDVAKAANRADANSAVIQAEDTQLYYGRNGRLLKIGGLTVMDRYQPDANVEVFNPMSIEGELEPGAQVELAYQIMPGQSDTVQGISLLVVAPPSEEVPEVQLPTVEAPAAVGCNADRPEGWVPYEINSGDNLTFLANRGSVSIDKIMEVNCLEDESLLIGDRIYVPAESLNTEVPVLQCGSTLPEDWVLYEVQAGDNLSIIANRSETSVTEIMAANCLDSDTILIGAKLYIPPEAVTEQ